LGDGLFVTFHDFEAWNVTEGEAAETSACEQGDADAGHVRDSALQQYLQEPQRSPDSFGA